MTKPETSREFAVWDAAFAAAFVALASKMSGDLTTNAEVWAPSLGRDAGLMADAALGAYRDVRPSEVAS